MKIKKGDEVKVIKGKDKGKTGKVEKIFPKINKIVVRGVNEYKRHLKARSQREPSEIITLTKPLSQTNVMIVCSKCKLPTRVGFMREKDGRIRICKKCKEKI